jgi:hypothetical protein
MEPVLPVLATLLARVRPIRGDISAIRAARSGSYVTGVSQEATNA